MYFLFISKKRITIEDEVNQYIKALIKEIKIKSTTNSMKEIPISSIFIGGGSPSILSPLQILNLGKTIKEEFNLNHLKEFSVEMSPNDIQEDKINALKEIGVTHARFGVQSFNQYFRKCFGLSSNLDNIYLAAEILPRYFPYVSFDMLYGMNGQTQEEFFDDLEKAINLGLSNIAFYPINNMVLQPVLHKRFYLDKRYTTSGITKFYMNVALRYFMKENNYLPHNGHEYVKVSSKEISSQPVLTNKYTFYYHQHVYGYDFQEVIGYGPNAVSTIKHHTLKNTDSIENYVKDILNKNRWEFSVGKHNHNSWESRGVVLRLPYHGMIEKDKIVWEKVDKTVLISLNRLIETGFIKETKTTYSLTEQGWFWYVNLIYFLCPENEKIIIDNYISVKQSQINNLITNCEQIIF